MFLIWLQEKWNKNFSKRYIMWMQIQIWWKKSNQKWYNNKCQCECKKHNICEKDYIGNSATFSCENGKY